MSNVNLGREDALEGNISSTLGSLAKAERDDADYVNKVIDLPISLWLYEDLKPHIKSIGVTKNFKEVIDYFKVKEGTPQGFRIEYKLEADGVVRVDLVRDIGYDRNGQERATNFLFSADSANPYEVKPISGLLANLTCNPGIVYDLFINNPKANVGNKFKTRDEVMKEIGNVLGPGCDISVELNNPFEESDQKILEEAEKFREMLSPYRIVIKVPHTGPVNAQNVKELLSGDKKFQRRYNEGATADMFRGHEIALMLRENGYRVNFTLMFEPHQTALALQAKPYFINCFIRHRHSQSLEIKRLLDLYRAGEDHTYLAELRTFFMEKDYLSAKDGKLDLTEVLEMAERIVKYRQIDNCQGFDGLDSVRHNLRMLKRTNLPDTRLIICSMEGPLNYPDIDNLITEPEFEDVMHKLIVTAEPQYLAKFTSCSQVISYQRRFMNAAQGES